MKVVIAVLLVMVLYACGPKFITFDRLGGVNKGMTRAEVEEVMNMSPEDYKTVKLKGTDYEVEHYPLQTAQETSSIGDSRVGGGYTTTQTTTVITNRTYFLYKGGKLRYWGMLGEFSKSEDLQIAEMADELYKFYNL